MHTHQATPSPEAAIRALINKRVQAICHKDVSTAVRHYAPDVLLYDVVGELAASGVAAVRQRLTDWLSSFAGAVAFEVAQLTIHAGNEVAFCSSLNHVAATTNDGNTLNMWWRETQGWQCINGLWMVTHAHSSVPFNAQDGTASIHLTPDHVTN